MHLEIQNEVLQDISVTTNANQFPPMQHRNKGKELNPIGQHSTGSSHLTG